MLIVLGSDHGGYLLKEQIKKHIKEKYGFEILDVGTNSEEAASWSEFGLKAATEVANNKDSLGIVICKSGIGVSIAANKVKGAYCGLCYDKNIADLLKKHDHCNMIAFGSEHIKVKDAIESVDKFIEAMPEGGRHQERFENLKNYEKSC